MDRKPSILSRIVRWIIFRLYRWKGWKLDGRPPESLKKFVIAGAPHTSNWDFVFFSGATQELGIKPNFMGKHTLFQGWLKSFMYDMGGIPVDRSKRSNYVDQVAAEYERRDELALVIAAEGSRTTDGSWKSGFYHIARAAGVPIIPAYVNNETMVLGFGPPIEARESYGETLMEIARYFRAKVPDYGRYKVLEAQARALIEEGK